MKRAVIFLLLSSMTLSQTTIESLKNKMKSIDSQIHKKADRIEVIESETQKLQRQIKEIEEDVKKIEKETGSIKEEIKIVNRNIDYGTRNLSISNETLEKKKSEYKYKMILWNRMVELDSNEKDNSITRRNYSKLLYGDLERITEIKKIKTDIEDVKKDIENQRYKLGKLKNRLEANKRSIEGKKVEQARLITKLNREKVTHKASINKLQVQKKSIEKEIEKIIKARSVTNKNIKLDTALLKLGKMQRPVSGKTVVKFHEKKSGQVVSNGIEIQSRMGSKIKAATGGKVIYADRFQGLNNVVMIDYGYNTIGVYGNLISVGVKLNQTVKKGQEIGVLGLTAEQQARLYYEVRFKLKPINPEHLF